MEKADSIAEQLRLRQVVGREDDRLAAIALGAHEGAQEARGQNVEAGGRFVEDHHRRIVQHGARDGEPLALAGRERLAPASEERFEIERPRQRRDARVGLPSGHAVQAREVVEQLAPGQPRVEPGRVGQEAEAAAHLQRIDGHVDPGDQRSPLGGGQDPGQDAQGGGLAGTVRPEQAVDLTRGDREGEPIDRGLAGEALDQRIDDDGRFAHGSPRIARRRSAQALTGAGRAIDSPLGNFSVWQAPTAALLLTGS